MFYSEEANGFLWVKGTRHEGPMRAFEKGTNETPRLVLVCNGRERRELFIPEQMKYKGMTLETYFAFFKSH